MGINPMRVAAEYYFGDLQYWKLPQIAADALEDGYDGPALKRLAGLANLGSGEIRAEDLPQNEIDSAFCEMGVDAPIAKHWAQMILVTECVARVIGGQADIFDTATHIRIHLCGFSEPPESLRRIVQLSNEAMNAPRSEWSRIETDLKDAFVAFWRYAEKLPNALLHSEGQIHPR